MRGLRHLLAAVTLSSACVADGQLNFIAETSYDAQNEITIGVALRNYLGKEYCDALFDIPIRGNVKKSKHASFNTFDKRSYGMILHIIPNGEIKELGIAEKRDTLGFPKLPHIDNTAFIDYLIENRYIFTTPVYPGNYSDKGIIRMLTNRFIPSFPTITTFPGALRKAVSRNTIIDHKGTIADLFQRNPFLLQFAINSQEKLRQEPEYLTEIQTSPIYNSMLVYSALTKCFGDFTLSKWCGRIVDELIYEDDDDCNVKNHAIKDNCGGIIYQTDKRKKKIRRFYQCMDMTVRITVDKNGFPKSVHFLRLPPAGFTYDVVTYNCKYNEEKMLCCFRNYDVRFISDDGSGFPDDENIIEVSFPGVMQEFRDRYGNPNLSFHGLFRNICKDLYLLSLQKSPM